MKLRYSLLSIIFLSSFSAFADSTPAFLDQLKGCFNVSYYFVDDLVDKTFFAPEDKTRPILEWLIVDSKGKDTYELRHWVKRPGDDKSSSHFYEAWEKTGKDAWSQQIKLGETMIRYGCSMNAKSMNEAGEKTFTTLECLQADRLAPKPNRDGERKDYNRILRAHHIIVGPKLWTQTEANHKYMDREDKKELISSDIGAAYYKRLPDSACAEIVKGM